MSRIVVDTYQFPLVTIRFPAEPVTDEDLRPYLGTLGALAAAGHQFATVTDMRPCTTPLTASQLWVFGAWLRDNASALDQCSIANAVVTNSPVMRSSVATAFWSWREQPMFKLFDEPLSARRWCRARLRRLGVFDIDAPDATPASVPAPPDAHAQTLDLFREPAYLVTPKGEVVFANRAALRAFPRPPAWLPRAVSRGPAGCAAQVRIARVNDRDRELYVVIPAEGAALAALPPSLTRIAEHLSRGLSDKDIARATGLTVDTVRTYVRRLYRRAGVHSRGELVRRWLAPT